MEKKQTKRIIAWLLAAALVVLLAVMPLLAAGEGEAEGPRASILSTTAQLREIAPVLRSGGLLESSQTLELTIPAQVKLERYLVGNGDVVAEGDPIALVDQVSVMTAITQVQQTLEELSADLETERRQSADTAVKALAGGTVKAVYAQPGEAVADVMLEHGALAVLSLDNLMAVPIHAGTELTAGDRVTVTPEGSEPVTGTVVSNLEGTLVVTLTDKGYSLGTAATVTGENGEAIGTGALELYSPWNAVGYSGTVSALSVREGQKVSAGQILLRLTDTGNTARYHALVAQRQEYEALLQELFRMHGTGVLAAPCDGIVSGVDPDGAFVLEDAGGQSASASGSRCTVGRLSSTSESAILTETLHPGTTGAAYSAQLTASEAGGTWAVSQLPAGLILDSNTGLLSGTPTQAFCKDVTVYYILGENRVLSKVLTMEILEAQPKYTAYPAKVSVVIEGYVEVLQSETAIPVSDLNNLPRVSPADEELTLSQGYAFSISPREVSQGDVVLLVFDETGTLVKVARQTAEESEKPDQSGTVPGGTGGRDMSGFGGMGAPGAQQEEQTLYSLDTLTVAVITSQEEMQLPITVDEGDILYLREGMTADVTVDALGGAQFSGEIRRIAITGTNDGGRSKFAVTVGVERSGDMYPGMTGSVRIPLEEEQQVVAVPVAALTEQGDKVLVYTGYDEENQCLTGAVEVTTGISDGEYVQVAGLEAGSRIYYAYYDTLEPSFAPESGR